eukprot:5893829-Amphidinium_carterae.1
MLEAATWSLQSQCWTGGLTYEKCCLPLPRGNPLCWDGFYTPELCCDVHNMSTVQEAAPLAPKPTLPQLVTLSQMGGCELSIYQRFKFRAAAWFLNQKASLALINDFATLINDFEEAYIGCAPAALTALLLKLETIYYFEDRTWQLLFNTYVQRAHAALAQGRLLQSHLRNGWPLER